MEKIKKVFRYKIIAILTGILCLFSYPTYAFDIRETFCLRKPLTTNLAEETNRLANLLTDTGKVIGENGLLPLDFSNSEWLPDNLIEQVVRLEELEDHVCKIINIIQSELAKGFQGSVFLIGSSVINKRAADIDIMIGERTKDIYLSRAFSVLQEGLKQRLMRELSISEEQVEHTFPSFRNEVRALKRTVFRYGSAYRITYDRVFKITAAPEVNISGGPAIIRLNLYTGSSL